MRKLKNYKLDHVSMDPEPPRVQVLRHFVIFSLADRVRTENCLTVNLRGLGAWAWKITGMEVGKHCSLRFFYLHLLTTAG